MRHPPHVLLPTQDVRESSRRHFDHLQVHAIPYLTEQPPTAGAAAHLEESWLQITDSYNYQFTDTSGNAHVSYKSQVLLPIWKDPVCGDGNCEWPWEFPAWGRFGCKADCGTNPNTTSIVVRGSV